MARTPGLFDMDERLQRLSDIGDPLEAFAAVVDFEMFRPELDAAWPAPLGWSGVSLNAWSAWALRWARQAVRHRLA